MNMDASSSGRSAGASAVDRPRDRANSQEDEPLSPIRLAAPTKSASNLVQVRELASNTNLHVAPDNWLQGEFTDAPWLPGPAGHRQADAHAKFGINMKSVVKANEMLDGVGRLDVMSDATTIKKVLTLPYRKQQDLSVLIHRIGRTLLIDPADVGASTSGRRKHADHQHQHELMQMAARLNQPEQNALVPVPVNRKVLEEKLIMSKFLYHSLDKHGIKQAVDSVVEYVLDNHETGVDGADEGVGDLETIPSSLSIAPVLRPRTLPDPLDSENDLCTASTTESPTKPPVGPPPPLTSAGERNVCWTFEDSRMLIDTNIPIFGCGQHPCVSLRLKDMKKPITVLTGLDYWLDQLMCNVPEVLMCYHLHGIVQKYEMLKTEDLPNCTETPFDPEEIRDVASNIFSFLKSNATKEGHTYWLFKGENDDVVKLYDLSSVCSDLMDVDANPYTLPVAIVMYRVAHNLMQQARSVRRVANTVYRLLNNCLELLPTIKYPQVVGSVHYLIANLYITYAYESLVTPDTEADDLFAADFESDSWASTLSDLAMAKKSDPKSGVGAEHTVPSVSLQALCHKHHKPQTSYNQDTDGSTRSSPAPRRLPLPNSTNRDDCCKTALEHVVEGLEFVDSGDKLLSNVLSVNQSAFSSNDATSQSAPPADKPIPMKYEPLYSAPQCTTLIPYAVRRPRVSTWQTQLYCLLLSRASLAYFLLTDATSQLEHYGRSLRHIRCAITCLASVMSVHDSLARPSGAVKKSDSLCRSLLVALVAKAADQYVMLSKLTSNECGRHEFELSSGSKMHFRDRVIINVANKSLLSAEMRLDKDYDWVTSSIPSSSFKQLELAVKCYSAALDLVLSEGRAKIEASSSYDAFALIVPVEQQLRQKLGNAHNDVAKFYTAMLNDLVVLGRLDESQSKQLDDDKVLSGDATEQLLFLVDRSLHEYQAAITQLNVADDVANEALVYNNCARVMRLHSHAVSRAAATHGQVDVVEFTRKEHELLSKAMDFYLRATECLARGVSSADPKQVQHLANSQLLTRSQLAGLYYYYALQLQDRPPLSTQPVADIERDIADYMHRAVNLYEKQLSADVPQIREEAYNRLFDCHHRLAAMYHNTHRKLVTSDPSSRRAKNVRTLTEMHYKKTDQLFEQWMRQDKHIIVQRVLEYVRVTMQHVAYHEHNADVAANTSVVINNNRQALITLLDSTKRAIAYLAEYQTGLAASQPAASIQNSKSKKQIGTGKRADKAEKSTKKTEESNAIDWLDCEDDVHDWLSLCTLVVNRLQHIIQALLKAHIKNKASDTALQSSLKTAYAKSLSLKPDDCAKQPAQLVVVCDQIVVALDAFLHTSKEK